MTKFKKDVIQLVIIWVIVVALIIGMSIEFNNFIEMAVRK